MADAQMRGVRALEQIAAYLGRIADAAEGVQELMEQDPLRAVERMMAATEPQDGAGRTESAQMTTDTTTAPEGEHEARDVLQALLQPRAMPGPKPEAEDDALPDSEQWRMG